MKAAFIIQNSDAKKRLDAFLSGVLPEFSRAQIQKIIKSGGVTVNDIPITVPHHFLKEGVVITFRSVLDGANPPAAEDKQKQEASPPVTVIAQTNDYLIVEKPHGLLVHAATESATAEPTLADWIASRFPECSNVGDDPSVRPGIVHRLDKEASGVMVIARTQEMFDHLKSQFKSHAVSKEYLALAHGVLPQEEGTITFAIARSKDQPRMAARADGQEGKKAATKYRVEKKFTSTTLARVMPKTGRTHQVRVHFFALGHALVGDPLYRHKKQNRKLDAACGRLFLHATRLSFTLPGGETASYESPLPKELAAFLSTLKGLSPNALLS